MSGGDFDLHSREPPHCHGGLVSFQNRALVCKGKSGKPRKNNVIVASDTTSINDEQQVIRRHPTALAWFFGQKPAFGNHCTRSCVQFVPRDCKMMYQLPLGR